MDASYELIVAALNRLRATAAVTAIVGAKIFDRVPERQTADGPVPDVESPYISMGPSTAIPDDYDCMDGEEITIQIDAWSWGSAEAYSSAQVRKLAGAIKKALHDIDLTLTTNALVTLQHAMTRVMRDPDGITNHAAVQFTATIETP